MILMEFYGFFTASVFIVCEKKLNMIIASNSAFGRKES